MKKYFSKVGLAAVILYGIAIVIYEFFTVHDIYNLFTPFVLSAFPTVFLALVLLKFMWLLYLINGAIYYFIGLFFEFILKKFRGLGLVLITLYLATFVFYILIFQIFTKYIRIN